MIDSPRIYVACLAAYNSGFLHGVWIDATDEVGDIFIRIVDMLKASPVDNDGEYAIHDYEGFGSLSLSEYERIDSVHEMAVFIEEHDELGTEVLSHFCGDIDEARKALEEDYNGEYKSLADYAQELTEDTTEIPQHLVYYIDYEAMGRDMEMGGDVFTIETGYEQVHVFWNH